MKSRIEALRKKLNDTISKKVFLEEHIEQTVAQKEEAQKNLYYCEEAREILRAVGKKTQELLQYHVGDITSLAMEGIFSEPYNIVIDFVQRRNKTECDIFFEDNKGNRIDPLTASGCGAVDVAAFALRIASWSMSRPRATPLIILDEPMRFLSVDLQENASTMIKDISDKLGIQFIIITHESTIASYADNIVEVHKNRKKGVSSIK